MSELFDFGRALEILKHGGIVARDGWNGKGLMVFMQVPAVIPEEIIPKMQSLPESVKRVLKERGGAISYSNQLALIGTDGSINGWAPSVSDSLANDWMDMTPHGIPVPPLGNPEE